MPKYFGQRIADRMSELAGLPSEDRDVVAYGLEYLTFGIIGLGLMLLIGLTLGRIWETLAIICCWVSLRVFAGGAHCTALWRCMVVNCLGLLIALLITIGALNLLPAVLWIGAATTWSLLAAWLWSPNNSERPVYDPLRRQRLRRRALVLVVLVGLILLILIYSKSEIGYTLAVAGATGMVSGAFMISPAGFWFVLRVDQKLKQLGDFLSRNSETNS